MWCGGARETHWATFHIRVTVIKTNQSLRSPCFLGPYGTYFNYYYKPFLHSLQRIFQEHWGGETFPTFLSWVESARMSNYAPFAPDIPNQPEKFKIVIDRSFFIDNRWWFYAFLKSYRWHVMINNRLKHLDAIT